MGRLQELSKMKQAGRERLCVVVTRGNHFSVLEIVIVSMVRCQSLPLRQATQIR